MARVFRLDIVTRERTVFASRVQSVVAPGVEGYFGVRPGHAPFLTELGVGRVTIRGEHGQELRLAVSGGFLEVSSEKATVLAETAEAASEIDRDRAERAVDRARRRLAGETGEASVDPERARVALRRAVNRLDLT